MKRCRTGRHRSFLSRHRRLPMLWWWFHHPKLYLQSDRYLYILQILSSIHMFLQYIRNQLDSFYYSRLVRLHTKKKHNFIVYLSLFLNFIFTIYAYGVGCFTVTRGFARLTHITNGFCILH